jgi:hypothetical protein
VRKIVTGGYVDFDYEKDERKSCSDNVDHPMLVHGCFSEEEVVRVRSGDGPGGARQAIWPQRDAYTGLRKRA